MENQTKKYIKDKSLYICPRHNCCPKSIDRHGRVLCCHAIPHQWHYGTCGNLETPCMITKMCPGRCLALWSDPRDTNNKADYERGGMHHDEHEGERKQA